jgi:hypothetical protein
MERLGQIMKQESSVSLVVRLSHFVHVAVQQLNKVDCARVCSQEQLFLTLRVHDCHLACAYL